MMASSLRWSMEPNVFLEVYIGEVYVYVNVFYIFASCNNGMDLSRCVSHWFEPFLVVV